MQTVKRRASHGIKSNNYILDLLVSSSFSLIRPSNLETVSWREDTSSWRVKRSSVSSTTRHIRALRAVSANSLNQKKGERTEVWLISYYKTMIKRQFDINKYILNILESPLQTRVKTGLTRWFSVPHTERGSAQTGLCCLQTVKQKNDHTDKEKLDCSQTKCLQRMEQGGFFRLAEAFHSLSLIKHIPQLCSSIYDVKCWF